MLSLIKLVVSASLCLSAIVVFAQNPTLEEFIEILVHLAAIIDWIENHRRKQQRRRKRYRKRPGKH